MKKLTKYIAFCICASLAFSLGSCKVILGINKLEKLEIFSISADQQAIILDGVINSPALEKFKILTEKHPTIKQLQIVNCDGSINDDVNLELAKFIHQSGFDIHLLDNGLVASGGTDLFLAGHKRTRGTNTKMGVHSWGGLFKTAMDFPKGHEHHLPYIEYYKSVDFTQQEAEDFYYFTINAAAADDIHWMTEEEISKYKML